jgi:hypothetical protein
LLSSRVSDAASVLVSPLNSGRSACRRSWSCSHQRARQRVSASSLYRLSVGPGVRETRSLACEHVQDAGEVAGVDAHRLGERSRRHRCLGAEPEQGRAPGRRSGRRWTRAPGSGASCGH